MSDIIHYSGRTYDLKIRISFYSYLTQTKGLSANDLSYIEKYFITDYESLLNKISELTTENATLKKRLEGLRGAIFDNHKVWSNEVTYTDKPSEYYCSSECRDVCKALDQDDKLAGGGE